MASSSGHWPLASSSSPPSASTSEASSRLPPWASAYLESEALRQWPPCKRKRPQPGQSVTSPMASEMASQPSRQWPHSESSPVNSEMASEASNQMPPWPLKHLGRPCHVGRPDQWPLSLRRGTRHRNLNQNLSTNKGLTTWSLKDELRVGDLRRTKIWFCDQTEFWSLDCRPCSPSTHNVWKKSRAWSVDDEAATSFHTPCLIVFNCVP